MAAKELVIISGKGGTGKTSITASLAYLFKNIILADCDVDAADLHLVTSPELIEKHDFYSGKIPKIRNNDCSQCALCSEYCRFDAIGQNDDGSYFIDPIACEGCCVCVEFCPEKAIDAIEALCGKWMISKTRFGKMVHAKLGIAAENSGKLVSTVRKEAKQIAEKEKASLILVDGPPGIGCPVIASITGANLVLVITEPTLSGFHDLERVLSLANHFKIPALVCINKWDLNHRISKEIEDKVLSYGAKMAGKIRYDNMFTKAQIQALSIVETKSDAASDVKALWDEVQKSL